jgi:hypothetical protein
MGRPAAAHVAWPQRRQRGGGLSLVTGRQRDLARVRKASSARPRRVQYSFLRMSIYSFLLQHDRCCRRRHQRRGRIQERSSLEMYTVSMIGRVRKSHKRPTGMVSSAQVLCGCGRSSCSARGLKLRGQSRWRLLRRKALSSSVVERTNSRE